MGLNDRNKEANGKEDQQVQQDNAARSTSINEQPIAEGQSNTDSSETNGDDQEGWVAVGSGLGIDE